MEHPRQPEIDVIWYDPNNEKLHAGEVKYFRRSRRRKKKVTPLPPFAYELYLLMNPEPSGQSLYSRVDITLTPKSYYRGVDEALALLNYGVDHAWLIHIFDTGIWDLGEGYASWSLKIIQYTPLGYLVIYVNEKLEIKELKKLREPLCLTNREFVLKNLREKFIRGMLSDPDCRPAKDLDNSSIKTLDNY